MKNVLGYEGQRVLVTGCSSGMGEAAAQLLVELGAEVVGLDIKPTSVLVKTSLTLDLADPAAIDAAVGQLGAIDAIFSVAGLPGPPFSDLETMTVNFLGARHLIEALVPAMPDGSAVACVASVGGLGWQNEFDSLLPLISTTGFEEGRSWCEAHLEEIATTTAYIFSKKTLNAWVAWRGVTLMQERGIRLNCINPGPTNTGMMPAFEAQFGAGMIDAFLGPSSRRSTSVEQAWPLLFLNSPRSSFIAGEGLQTDAGFTAALASGQLNVELPSDLAAQL